MRTLRLGAGLLLGAAMLACRAPRPEAPPPYVEEQPYGVVARGNEEPVCSAKPERADAQETTHSERPALLALSGGGAFGAYGAGLLVGWSEAKTRPKFRVVTGVSTGALIATFAFLGEKYDEKLTQFYTTVGNRDIFKGRSLLKVWKGDALNDTAPLRAIIDDTIDEKILAEVAAEHRAGRRLYVGTTDMDKGEFVVWDLGAVAASSEPDKLKRYRDLLQASSALPGFFPPVYIPVEHDGKTYHQLHSDVISTTMFLRTFMLDDAGVGCRPGGESTADVYAVINWRMAPPERNEIAEPTTMELTMLAMTGLHRWALTGSLYEMTFLSQAYRASLHETHIPKEFHPGFEPMDFNTEGMKKLFAYGRERGKTNTAFQTIVR